MNRALIPAAIATFMALSPAQALPIAADTGVSHAPALTLIADRDEREGRMNRDRDDNHRNYTPGRRYKSAPSGWNRYDRRPGDWRSRRCILVGPIWFCP